MGHDSPTRAQPKGTTERQLPAGPPRSL